MVNVEPREVRGNLSAGRHEMGAYTRSPPNTEVQSSLHLRMVKIAVAVFRGTHEANKHLDGSI